MPTHICTVEKSQAIGLSTEKFWGFFSLFYHVFSIKADDAYKQYITYVTWEVLIQESDRRRRRVLNSYVHRADQNFSRIVLFVARSSRCIMVAI